MARMRLNRLPSPRGAEGATDVLYFATVVVAWKSLLYYYLGGP
jgi:hypothetical protein